MITGKKQKSTYQNGKSANEQYNNSNKNKHNTNKNLLNDNGEVLDLGDLDLSQLRLTKKDLETLSNLTPGLTKRLQEQLLAQLPPNQARKLSRTLSMQNSNSMATASVNKEYTRSQSSGVGDNKDHSSYECYYKYDRDDNHYSGSVTPTNENEPLRKSLSKGKHEKDLYNRSNRSSEECDSRAYCSSSHSNNTYDLASSASPPPLPPYYYDTRTTCLSPTKDLHNRLPVNGCTSPPPLPNDTIACRKSLNRRISRFLRPDFYDIPVAESSTAYEREKLSREFETQKILREIREKSRDRSIERQLPPKLYQDNNEMEIQQRHISRHRSLSKSKEITNNQNIDLKPLKDKILEELNNLSILQIDSPPVTFNDENGSVVVENKPVTKPKVKKLKAKQPKAEPQASVCTIEDCLEKPVDTLGMKTIKKESKLQRPKSYPIKATENLSNSKLVGANDGSSMGKFENDVPTPNSCTSKIVRPKSFPHSKITPPKDVKKIVDIMTPSEDLQAQTYTKSDLDKAQKDVEVASTTKIVKKSTTKTKVAKLVSSKASSIEEVASKAESSPEKKLNKGFLYSIGQKFEKFRDATKNKEKDRKSSVEPNPSNSAVATKPTTKIVKTEKNKKETTDVDNEEKCKTDRISKIDAMIRNLRDRSVPRGPEITESGLIKRAVSVEEMPGTFNKCGVNKVLGLFKKIEKDNVDKSKKVLNAKSTSYISAMNNQKNNICKERPKSSNFVNRHEDLAAFVATSSASKVTSSLMQSCQQRFDDTDSPINQTDSIEDLDGDENFNSVSKRHSKHGSDKERLKNNRKALLLDFSQINENKIQNCDQTLDVNHLNNNHSELNNHRFTDPSVHHHHHDHHHHHHVLNNNLSTSAFENFNNYRSPDDEPHTPLSSAFDSSESYLSDEHISPTVSRKSSHHYIHAPNLLPVDTRTVDSVNDRIRRKSFYSRFNENKPRRISHIVGPAAKDYYSLEREPSEPIPHKSTRHQHEYSRSLTTNIPEPMKSLPQSYYRPMKYPMTNDYSKSSSSTDADYQLANRRLLEKQTKRRSSNILTPTTTTSQLSTPIQSHLYTTLGRKIQPYNHRSISLLDSSSSSGMSSLIREHSSRTTTENGLLLRCRSRNPSQNPAD